MRPLPSGAHRRRRAHASRHGQGQPTRLLFCTPRQGIRETNHCLTTYLVDVDVLALAGTDASASLPPPSAGAWAWLAGTTVLCEICVATGKTVEGGDSHRGSSYPPIPGGAPTPYTALTPFSSGGLV